MVTAAAVQASGATSSEQRTASQFVPRLESQPGNAPPPVNCPSEYEANAALPAVGAAKVMQHTIDVPELSQLVRLSFRYSASVPARHPPRLCPVTQRLIGFAVCDLRNA